MFTKKLKVFVLKNPRFYLFVYERNIMLHNYIPKNDNEGGILSPTLFSLKLIWFLGLHRYYFSYYLFHICLFQTKIFIVPI